MRYKQIHFFLRAAQKSNEICICKTKRMAHRFTDLIAYRLCLLVNEDTN